MMMTTMMIASQSDVACSDNYVTSSLSVRLFNVFVDYCLRRLHCVIMISFSFYY